MFYFFSVRVKVRASVWVCVCLFVCVCVSVCADRSARLGLFSNRENQLQLPINRAHVLVPVVQTDPGISGLVTRREEARAQ